MLRLMCSMHSCIKTLHCGQDKSVYILCTALDGFALSNVMRRRDHREDDHSEAQCWWNTCTLSATAAALLRGSGILRAWMHIWRGVAAPCSFFCMCCEGSICCAYTLTSHISLK